MSNGANADRLNEDLQEIVKLRPTPLRVTAEIATASGLTGGITGTLYYNPNTGDYTLVNYRDKDSFVRFRLQSVLYVLNLYTGKPLLHLR